MIDGRVRALRDAGALGDVDVHFAGLLSRLGETSGDVLLAAALASRAAGQGHSCLDLAEAEVQCRAAGVVLFNGVSPVDVLLDSRVVALNSNMETRPLVLSAPGRRLYLRRYWEYEDRVARWVLSRAAEAEPDLDVALARDGLARLFPPSGPLDPEGQKAAAAATLLRRFSVISGGPGTGKTTTVVKVLALLLEQAGAERLRVALAASTGKAAARLTEAVRGAVERLACSSAVAAAIPAEASTVHRLLGAVGGSASFRHGADNPLPYDLVVVDEVSMVDLALFAKLLAAVQPSARLVLLGDRDQLASVEAGAVLGDLCDTGARLGRSPRFAGRLARLTGGPPEAPAGPPGPGELRDCISVLNRSYRFGPESGIGAAARAVNDAGDGGLALKILTDEANDDVGWYPAQTRSPLPRALAERAAEGYLPFLRAGEPAEALERFQRFRVLCAHRQGPWGADQANREVERALAARGLVRPEGAWYPGRPVLVTSNDYGLRLYNGDVGLALADPDEEGALRVFFPSSDGRLRRLSPLRLPACETAYAMTVHRSQGSEFDEVVLALGAEPSRVLSRELLYTGLTRARRRVEVWGSREAFLSAAERRSLRTSGLRDALWGAREGAP